MFRGDAWKSRARPSLTKQNFSPVVRVNGTGAKVEFVTIPAFQIADVQELLEHGSKVVVLSRGMAECLHVARETLDFLKERQIPVHVLPTQHAVTLYNKLAQTEAVGGLFHTTC